MKLTISIYAYYMCIYIYIYIHTLIIVSPLARLSRLFRPFYRFVVLELRSFSHAFRLPFCRFSQSTVLKVYIYIYTHTCICVYTYVYIYIYICTHVYIRTYYMLSVARATLRRERLHRDGPVYQCAVLTVLTVL